MDKQREKELIRAQLNALKYLQARHQKQIKQLDKVRNVERARALRAASRVTETGRRHEAVVAGSAGWRDQWTSRRQGGRFR